MAPVILIAVGWIRSGPRTELSIIDLVQSVNPAVGMYRL